MLVVPPDPAKIGHDAETENHVRISAIDRQRGLYVLGTAGTGKTSLLLNLIDYDIHNGHGLFFLDPHGDAIASIRANPDYADRLARDGILLDPMHEQASFGINLLACPDPSSLNARTQTYTRTYRVFEHLFGTQRGDYGTWGVWLQEMIQYTLYAFIENPGYALTDISAFLTDPSFRAHLLRNVRYNPGVTSYWHNTFGALPPVLQTERVQSFHSRLNILLHPPVRHIVGHTESTIDFAEAMRQNAIVLVSLPASLSLDLKRIIGTLVLSELLYAVQTRPISQRHHFGIYVDEVQHFAYSEDFNILFTEARKYGIATTIAHQERFGQFADNKKMAGATAAAANLVCFQLSHYDAAELGSVLGEPQRCALEVVEMLSLERGRGHPKCHPWA